VKNNYIGTYYGLQCGSLGSSGFVATKMHFAHSSTNDVRNYAIGNNSGAISSYPYADKFIAINNTNKWLYILQMDLGFGTPADYNNMITDQSTNYRFLNPSKIYFTNISVKNTDVGDVISWHGGHHIKHNFSNHPYCFAYFMLERGVKYFVVDVTQSVGFSTPYKEIFSHPELNGKELEVVEKDASISLLNQVSDRVYVGGEGLDITADAYGVVKLKL
jgi:hypothetical protein